jgi:hypothetical protein
MNFKFYVEKLEESETFKKFVKENKKAYLGSVFFSIDKVESDNHQHFDFYIPRKKKMTSFQLEKGCEAVEIEILDKKIPDKVNTDLEFDFDAVEKLIEEKMKNEKIDNKIHKMLFSLQNVKGKPILIGTIFTSMLSLLRVNIDLSDMQITDFEKKSFFDIMKIISGKKD